eukprot:EC788979.1.p4 GENE.EC788979.1~~EC788979.1.p4  ORF type:complete len:71 (-),score=4.89 EC788979.1:199-411(-)
MPQRRRVIPAYGLAADGAAAEASGVAGGDIDCEGASAAAAGAATGAGAAAGGGEATGGAAAGIWYPYGAP